MKLTTALLCATPILFAPGSDAPRFAPAEDTTLHKTFRTELTLAFEELTSRMNGQDVPAMYLPVMDIQVHGTFEVSVLDRYGKVADGRPLAFERTIESAASETDQWFTMEPDVDEHATLEGTSLLEGEELAFLWDRDEEAYEVRYADGSDPDERLDGLVGDMDLLAFLPESGLELEEEGSWEVDAEALRSLLEPGGDLAMDLSGELDEARGPDEYELEGTLTATIAGRNDDGALRVELTGTAVRTSERATDLEMVPVADGTATEVITTELEVQGAFHWNTETNHLQSLELECPLEMRTVITKDPDQDGPDFESTVVMSGAWKFAVELGQP